MYVIKPAVRQKIEDHGLSIAEVEAVLAAPEQQVPAYGGRVIYQFGSAGFWSVWWSNKTGTRPKL